MYDQIITAVERVGFPIVVVAVLLIGFKYMFDRFMEKSDNEAKQHKEEMDSVTTALNNNTLVLQKLCDKLDTIAQDTAQAYITDNSSEQ